MGEINRLTWQDVDFDNRTVTLYTARNAVESNTSVDTDD